MVVSRHRAGFWARLCGWKDGLLHALTHVVEVPGFWVVHLFNLALVVGGDGRTLPTAASCYLKVNAHPYLFACDLEGEIDDAACMATVDDQGVVFQCKKTKPGIWGKLKSTGDKFAIKVRRAVVVCTRLNQCGCCY